MGRLNLKKTRTSSKATKKKDETKSITKFSKPAQKKKVLKRKNQPQHTKTAVKKIPPISQRAPKLLKRNEVVVLDLTEYKWTGRMWVNTKDNMIAPQYTSDRLNNRYPNREGI
ncbi:MAG: hypothetical protein JW832_10130 [Deltaproteobacteria bacterium]|nr:hypothetical protein [Deltaproteobacteria bacterium]